MHRKTNDNELWEDFKKGQTYALSHIYYLYIDQLFRYGKKFSKDDELVKDTIQDLFFDLIRTRENLGSTDHIYYYLIKAFRRRLFQKLNGAKNVYLINEVSGLQSIEFVYSAEDDFIHKEELSHKEKIVKKGLAGLSPKQREILYYRFTCDFEYDQICEIMLMKYDSARKMVFRALKLLREQLIETNISFFILLFKRSIPSRKNN
jgi:RNA polymerase sigma factor (sigma-70 family)